MSNEAGGPPEGGPPVVLLEEKSLSLLRSEDRDVILTRTDGEAHDPRLRIIRGGVVEQRAVRERIHADVAQARQAGPHAHSTYFSADNKRMYAADLGIDEVKVYGFDARSGKLTAGSPLKTPAGAGPRHLALGKKRVYVLNEIASSVSVFENGKLLETVNALPDGFTGASSAAEVVIDKAEKFLYSSNRGADTIAVFRIGAGLKKVGDVKVGPVPRGFVLSPDGKFLIAGSQTDSTIQVYRIDAKTGLLTAAGEAVKANGPICFRFRL